LDSITIEITQTVDYTTQTVPIASYQIKTPNG